MPEKTSPLHYATATRIKDVVQFSILWSSLIRPLYKDSKLRYCLFLFTGIGLMRVLKIVPPPLPQLSDQRNQCLSKFSERVFGFRRHDRKHLPMDQLILLQFPQLERQCSRGCLGNQPLKLAEPLFFLDKMPQNERLVLSELNAEVNSAYP